MAVESVLGPVAEDALGHVLMHEHLALGPMADRDGALAACAERLERARRKGIDTVVECTTEEMARDAQFSAEVSRASGMQIIAATGVHCFTFDRPPPLRSSRWEWLQSPTTTVDEAASVFVDEINHGLDGTDIKPGVIKLACDSWAWVIPGGGHDMSKVGNPITPVSDKLLRAGARAHRATGVPITTHTHATEHGGLAQVKVFTEEGVDLSRVVIGHSGDSTEYPYLRALMEAGCTLGMDRCGLETCLPTEDRVRVIADLCGEGYEGQMTMSQDHMCVYGPVGVADSTPYDQGTGNTRYDFISDVVLPSLRAAGVEQKALDVMLVDNPRKLLAPCLPY